MATLRRLQCLCDLVTIMALQTFPSPVNPLATAGALRLFLLGFLAVHQSALDDTDKAAHNLMIICA